MGLFDQLFLMGRGVRKKERASAIVYNTHQPQNINPIFDRRGPAAIVAQLPNLYPTRSEEGTIRPCQSHNRRAR